MFTCITLVLHLFGRKKLISSIRKRVKPFHRHTQITQEGCSTSALNDKERSLQCSQEEGGKERGVTDGKGFAGEE